MHNFLKSSQVNRIPIYANLQLTYKCNFRCLHCYQTPLKNTKFDELSTDEWKQIIDILKDRQVIFIHFTGGEVLSRHDFLEIYSYAYDKNFKIGISSNVSLLSQPAIEMLKNKKPYKVAISIYGMTNETYRVFTGSASYTRVKENIVQLKQCGINIFLKVIANKYNVGELLDAYKFANSNAIDFFSFFKINNFIDGDKTPVLLELDEEQVAFYQKEFGQLDKYIKYKSENRVEEKCTVGINIININPMGEMYLCECSQKNKWSLLKKGFEYCWEKVGLERDKEFEVDIECNKCNLRKYCNICPPLIKYRYGKLCKPEKECRYAQNVKRLVDRYDEI